MVLKQRNFNENVENKMESLWIYSRIFTKFWLFYAYFCVILSLIFRGVNRVMIKSKAIEALKSLNKTELRELQDFIESPFHNKNKTIRKLFAAIKPYHPSFENKKFTKEFIYSKILPGKEYADKTFRNLMSDLLELIESYLAYSELNRNPIFERYFRTIGISEKGVISLAERSIKDSDRLFENFQFDGGNIFYFMHLNEMEKDFTAIGKNKLINLNMKEGEYLIYAFLSKYLIFKMKYYNYLHKLGTEKLSGFITEFEKSINIVNFIKFLEERPSVHSEIILMYYYSTKFMSEPDAEAYYNKTKQLFEKNKQFMNRTEVINIYLTFSGYIISKMRDGNNKYARELFEMYRNMIEEKLIIGENEQHLHITIFNNIVTLALRLNEMEWAKNFTENYYSYLKPEFRETMYNFSYAQYYFREKKFELSLECMNRVNFENYYIKTGVRNLLLKIYFELKYTESFFSLSDSIRHYLSKDKLIPEDRKESDINFINHVTKLYKYCLEPSKDKLAGLKEDTETRPSGVHSEWLNKKIEELENAEAAMI